MMNPSSSGWIKKFFSIAGNLEEHLPQYDYNLSAEEKIYGYMQPTGFMYGFPTNLLFLPDEVSEKWSGEEKFKVLLLEGLLAAEISYSEEIIEDKIESVLKNFVSFYELTEIGRSKQSWFSLKGLDVYGKLESIIDQRVDIKISLSNKLWTNYLHNSLVFPDLIMYFEYRNGSGGKKLFHKRNALMLDMLKMTAAAAHADGEIAEEEATLFTIFMASARLNQMDRETAKLFWDESKPLKEVQFDYEMSWLLKRYFMEIAALMVWSDKIVVPEEQVFLDELGQRLELDEEEQDKSFIAIQSFVLENTNSVPFLSGKNEAEQLMRSASVKWKRILSRNKDRLSKELQQNKELVQLIAKSTTKDLSADEKKKVKNQFKGLAKTIPAFALFMLPGGSLVMPIVLKLIPDLIPTTFRTNQIDEPKKDQ